MSKATDKKLEAESHNNRYVESNEKLENRRMSIQEIMWFLFIKLVAVFNGAEVSVRKEKSK